MVVLPAASRPTIRMRISFFEKRRLNTLCGKQAPYHVTPRGTAPRKTVAKQRAVQDETEGEPFAADMRSPGNRPSRLVRSCLRVTSTQNPLEFLFKMFLRLLEHEDALKRKTGLMVARAAALRTNININGRPLPPQKRRRTSSKHCAPHILHASAPHFHLPVN